jgi:hypothetical protein
MRNISGHNAIINTVAINSDNVLASGGDNGMKIFELNKNRSLIYWLSLLYYWQGM